MGTVLPCPQGQCCVRSSACWRSARALLLVVECVEQPQFPVWPQPGMPQNEGKWEGGSRGKARVWRAADCLCLVLPAGEWGCPRVLGSWWGRGWVEAPGQMILCSLETLQGTSLPGEKCREEGAALHDGNSLTVSQSWAGHFHLHRNLPVQLDRQGAQLAPSRGGLETGRAMGSQMLLLPCYYLAQQVSLT